MKLLYFFLSMVLLLTLNSKANEYYVGHHGLQLSKLKNLREIHLIKNYKYLEIAIVKTDSPGVLKKFDFFEKVRKKIIINTKNIATSNLNITEQIPWGINAIRAPNIWKITRGKGAKVLVLDSGVDKNHPAFKNKLIIARDFTGSFETNNLAYPEFDITGHGTHVSGIILGDSNRLSGVAPEADLYMGKVCIFLCLDQSAIVSAFEWALEKKVDVINMSFSSKLFSANLAKRILRKLEEYNIVAVAASGNSGHTDNLVSFPAKYQSVLAVGAVDINKKVAYFSSYNENLAIVAPGVNIISSSLTKGINKTESLLIAQNGTSMAAPHVTGLVALIRSLRPNLDAKVIRKIILKTSKIPPNADNSKNQYGHGLINAQAAIQMAQQY